MNVDYFEYPGVPGRYFSCAAHKASLSESRCAAMYQEAKGIQLGDMHSLEKCIGCPVGAVHAGDKVVQKKESVVGRLTCCRCHEQASRLVCGGICVSCFNREREVVKGRNGKGCPPKPVDRFWMDEPPDGKVVVTHPVVLTVSVAGRVRAVAFERVADTLEAVLRSMRNVRDEVFFARRPANLGGGVALFQGVFREKAKRRYFGRKAKTAYADHPGQMRLLEVL